VNAITIIRNIYFPTCKQNDFPFRKFLLLVMGLSHSASSISFRNKYIFFRKHTSYKPVHIYLM